MTTNLRQRIALGVGLITTLVVIAFGSASWIFTARSLESATDDELRNTIPAIKNALRDFDQTGLEPGPPTDEDGESRLPGLYFQVLGPDGTVLVDGGIPVSDQAKLVAAGDAAASGETVLERASTSDGIRLRTATSSVAEPGPVAAIQIARDVTDIHIGLRRARTTTIVAGVLAGLAASAIALALSRRLVAPVSAVAEAADRLRSSRELPERLEGEGPDELGRLVTSFNGLLDELRESRGKQQRLVADASHELRTPLTTLRVNTEFLQSQPDLPAADRGRLLDGTVAEVEALSRMVDELVHLAADGAAPTEMPKLVDLAALVAEEVERFGASTGRPVTVQTQAGLIETRPGQARRALINLLTNANKYTPADGAIVVTQVGPRIEVRDHGPGIPDADRDRVFDRFYRGPAHQGVDGSGLGLAIVAAMAGANGGSTWVRTPEDGLGAIVGFSVGPGT